GVFAQRAVRAGPESATRRRQPGLRVPLPRVDLRSGGPSLQEQARPGQPAGAALQVRVRHGRADRRRHEGLIPPPRITFGKSAMGLHNTDYKGLLGWIDARMPTLMQEYKKHMSEYYAPKNFNFWYYFGAFALTVLVIQIVTGIFLVMHY